MPRYVAFLRGINLGKRRPPMSHLKELFEELGFDDVATFIASGNVIFTTRKQDLSKLESRIAKHLESTLGYSVDTFVRSAERVVEIGRSKVFPEDGHHDFTVHVGFLHEALPVKIAKTLEAIREPDDAFRVIDKEYYWLRRGRISDSEIWNHPDIKAIKFPTSSMRSMKSLRKLIAKFFPES